MKPDFYLLTEHIKIIVFSPFCSIRVIFVILIRIYRMGEYTRVSARVGGSARNQGKQSFPFSVIPFPVNLCKPVLLSLFQKSFNLFQIPFNCLIFAFCALDAII